MDEVKFSGLYLFLLLLGLWVVYFLYVFFWRFPDVIPEFNERVIDCLLLLVCVLYTVFSPDPNITLLIYIWCALVCLLRWLLK